MSAPPDQPSRAAADAILAELGVVPRVRWEFDGLATIAGLVAAGTGAALLPRLALLGLDRAGPDLPVRRLEPARYRRVDAVTRSGSAARPALAAVREALAAERRRIAG